MNDLREQIKASNAFLFIFEAIQEVEKMQEPLCECCGKPESECDHDELFI